MGHFLSVVQRQNLQDLFNINKELGIPVAYVEPQRSIGVLLDVHGSATSMLVKLILRVVDTYTAVVNNRQDFSQWEIKSEEKWKTSKDQEVSK